MPALDHDVVRAFLGCSHHTTEIRVFPLAGGLESTVARVDSGGGGRTGLRTFVVKKLEARGHEARAYRLLRDLGLDVAPELLAVRDADDGAYLFVEWVPSESSWPWADLAWARRVTERLARLHEVVHVPAEVALPDYESALVESARETLEVVTWLSGPDSRTVTVRRTALRRFVERLPEVRRTLFEDGPFPPSLIHGDVHPGNAIVHAGRGEPVLIDWARTRLGSPFEDVGSWLQSLGLWEPRARRRHDQLLATYLRARGREGITDEIRDHYWLAAGCNALAGALRHHVVAALELPSESPERQRQVSLAARWTAIVRRADARWRGRARAALRATQA